MQRMTVVLKVFFNQNEMAKYNKNKHKSKEGKIIVSLEF